VGGLNEKVDDETVLGLEAAALRVGEPLVG
jgi:hypothetical protein